LPLRDVAQNGIDVGQNVLEISKTCLSPKLKTHAEELSARKVKLKQELKIRSEEEKPWAYFVSGQGTMNGRCGAYLDQRGDSYRLARLCFSRP
jgi:hypothetical protein